MKQLCLIFNFLSSKKGEVVTDKGIPILGTISSVVVAFFAYATRLEGVLLYIFMAIMTAIILSILFLSYLTISKKYDYHSVPRYKGPSYSEPSRSFRRSKRGIGTIVKSFVVVFAFCIVLGVLNQFFDVFAMFDSGLSFVMGLIKGALGNPVVDSVSDMIIKSIGGAF